jgi:hypothetical protein
MAESIEEAVNNKENPATKNMIDSLAEWNNIILNK